MTVVVLSDHGTYLGSSKEQFKISFGMSDKPLTYIPAIKVQGIIVDANITISSGAFKLLRHYGIPVIWQDFTDDGLILQPFNNHGSVEVRRAQYEALDDTRGIVVAAKFVYAGCMNKLTLLRRLQRQGYDDEIVTYSIRTISDKIQEFTNQSETYGKLDYDLRQQLMNTEAVITKQYFQVLQQILGSAGWEFSSRSRRPAEDPFNALLNYSYAVLRGQLTQFTTISGLDMYGGFLHTDRSGRESLVLDLIEEFRQVAVDELLLQLILKKKLALEAFEETTDGIIITKEIKEVLMPSFFAHLDSIYQHQSLRAWMINQPRELSNYLRGFVPTYQPFLLQVGDQWA